MSVEDTVTVDWENNAYDGDELVEIFRRLNVGPGPWAKVKTLLINAAATQSTPVTGHAALTAYDFAVRSQRGGLYRVGWESANPDLWSDGGLEVGAKVSAVPTGAVGLAITSAVWSRTSAVAEKVALAFAAPPAGCAVEVWVDTGTGFALEDTTAADATTYDYDATGHGEQNVSFKVRAVRGALTGSFGGTTVVWTGPASPAYVSVEFLGFAAQWTLTWENNVASGTLDLESNDDTAPGYPNDWAAEWSEVVLGDSQNRNFTQPCGPAVFALRIRHGQTAFGVTDYSEWVTDIDIPGC